MKKVFIGLLALSTLTACSKDEATRTSTEEPVPVRLSAGVPFATVSPDSKAVITGDATFAASVAGWEAAVGAVDYSAAPTWEATATDIQAEAKEQAITLTPSQVYNADDDVDPMLKFTFISTLAGIVLNLVAIFGYPFL